MKFYIGFDFGAKGAVAAIREDGSIHSYIKMPSHMFDLYSYLYENFDEVDDEVVAYGEELYAIFGAAAGSTFSFARVIGRAQGVIECLNIPFTGVKPRTWQELIFRVTDTPEMGDIPKGKKKFKRATKQMAAFAADALWPELDTNHDGIIDALLIAKYAQLTHKGE